MGCLGGETQRVINKNEGNSAVAVIEIPTGAVFQTYRYLVTADGRVSAVEGNEYVWPQGGLTWQSRPAPSGNYNVGVLLTAFGGVTGFIKESITVDNDSVPVDLRADTRPDLGVTIPRPQTWTPLSENNNFYTNPDWGDVTVLQTNDPENANLVLLMFSFPTEDLVEAIQTAADYNGFQVEGTAFTPIVVNGRDALQFDYTRQAGGKSRSGRAFVVIQELDMAGEFYGIVLASESVDGEGNFEEFYPALVEHVHFFDQLAFVNSKTPKWRIERLTPQREEFYWIPTAWERATPEEAYDENGLMRNGVWTRYTPVEESDDYFVAMARLSVISNVDSAEHVLSNVITGQA